MPPWPGRNPNLFEHHRHHELSYTRRCSLALRPHSRRGPRRVHTPSLLLQHRLSQCLVWHRPQRTLWELLLWQWHWQMFATVLCCQGCYMRMFQCFTFPIRHQWALIWGFEYSRSNLMSRTKGYILYQYETCWSGRKIVGRNVTEQNMWVGVDVHWTHVFKSSLMHTLFEGISWRCNHPFTRGSGCPRQCRKGKERTRFPGKSSNSNRTTVRPRPFEDKHMYHILEDSLSIIIIWLIEIALCFCVSRNTLLCQIT